MSADLGRVGYEAYAAFTRGKTYDGREMPAWQDLPDRTRRAWETAAGAIAQAQVDQALEHAGDKSP